MDQNPVKTVADSFLSQCDPRAKLGAFFLLMPLLLARPVTTPEGWIAPLFVILALWGAGLDHGLFFRQLLRLKWLFIALLAVHSLLTPGEPLWSGFMALSREGAVAGFLYCIRLVLMVSLAWVLIKTTTHLQIVVGIKALLGFLEKWGVPLERGLSLLAYTLGRIPHLIQEAGRIREDMACRLGESRDKKWQNRLHHLALAGEALLFRVLRNAQDQEEALRVRGISHGLPPLPPLTNHLGWRDGVILFSSCWALFVGF
jgi:energy-coupling factor transporter transmembrane protein EcfT